MAFQAIDSFKIKHHSYPSPWNQVDADKFMQVVKDHDSTKYNLGLDNRFSDWTQEEFSNYQKLFPKVNNKCKNNFNHDYLFWGKKWAYEDLNLEPADYESDALTN